MTLLFNNNELPSVLMLSFIVSIYFCLFLCTRNPWSKSVPGAASSLLYEKPLVSKAIGRMKICWMLITYYIFNPLGTSVPQVPYNPLNTSVPQGPSDPLNTSVPQVPYNPLNTSVPQGPSDPLNTSVPQVPSNPLNTSVPQVPCNPLNTSVPQVPSNPLNTSVPQVPSNPLNTSVPQVPYNPLGASVPQAPYSPVLGPNFEKALKISGHPKDWPFQVYAVKYPPLRISMYNNNMDTLVQELPSRASSQTSGCYPDITLEGCSTDAGRPTKYLPHEFVKIRVVPKNRSALCKNLVARFNKPVLFFEGQNNDDLTFEQKAKFFRYSVLYTALLGLEVLGSYQSVVGEDLVMDFNVTCFFKIDPPHTLVSVEGGSGTYDCSKPVEFRPVQAEPAFESDLFTLRWSCIDPGNPNSDQCQPVETKWGIKTYTLECDRVYRFALEPFHEYFKMTSPTGSSAGTPFEWTAETAWGATHIAIRCLNSCSMINPQGEVDLEAVESPHTGTDLVWRLFEEHETTPLPLSEHTNRLINKWTLSIKGDLLKPASRYGVVAETSKGRGEIIFSTNSPPRNGSCSIAPTVGIRGNTKFTVVCQNWTDDDNPILYSVGVVADGLYVALVDSFYPDKIRPFVLFFDTVCVTVQDRLGVATSVHLKVVLLHLGHKVVAIHSRGDFSSLKNEAITNSMIASTDDTIKIEQKIAILNSVSEILPSSKTVNDLEGLIGCVRLVLKRPNLHVEDGVHEIIKLAGQILRLASDVVLSLCMKKTGHYTLVDGQIRNAMRALVSVADTLFQTRDPYLLDDATASLDVQEVHKHKIKIGVIATLEALGVVLEGERATMIPNFGPVHYDVGSTVIFTSVGNAKTLQTQLDELGQNTATVRLSERTVALMGQDTYAVEVIITNKEAYWWKPVSGQVLHSKFFKWQHQSKRFRPIHMDLGPFDIPVKVDPDLNQTIVQGVADRAIEPCFNQCHRFLTIHRIKLPPGQGAVSLEMDPVHFGQIKMIAVQDSIPTYSEIDSVRPLNRAKVDIKYDNQGTRFISNFYIAVISAKEDVYQYEFKVQLGRCAYYVSEKWQSQGCQFKGIIKAKDGSHHAACQCSHLSTVGYRSILPVPDVPNFEDLTLLFSLKDNWIVVAVIGLILVAYFLLLIYGAIKDKQDHQKEALTELPDNYPGDTYPYIVIIVTGMRCRAGTSSKVAFQLFGSRSRSRPHLLKGGRLKGTLNRGCDDWLLLFTRKELGEIEEVVVWHSNTGMAQDWYCSQITVYDVKNDKPYAFKVRRWFKIDPQHLEESKLWRGEVNRVDWEVRETKPAKIFGDRVILNLKDQHNWAGIFLRHPRSVFTRCERIAALGSMIFSSMLTSVVYFGSGDFGASDVPGFSFTVEDIVNMVISFVLGLIIGKILSILTLSLFSLSKQKLKKPTFGPTVIKKRCFGLCKTKQKAELFDHIPITTNEGLKLRDAAKPSRLKCLRYLAWIVIVMSIFVFSFFIILYGLRFGTKRSLLWIQTVIGSLLLDAVIYGPAKMIFNAYLASRNKGALTHDYFMEIDPESLWPAPMNYYQRMERMWCRIRKEYKPLSHRTLLRMSKIRALSDFSYQYVMYFVFLGIMFTFILFFVQTFDTKARYLANTALHGQLTEPRSPGVLPPSEIVTAEEFVDYVNKTLLMSLHRHKWYNEELLHFEPSEDRVNVTDLGAGHKGWCIGLLNKLFGVPRLRQQRVTTKPWKLIDIDWSFWKFEWEVDVARTISPYFVKYFNASLNSLSEINEDKDNYKVGWQEYNPKTDKNLTNLWTFSDKSETVTGPYFEIQQSRHFSGELQSYNGEGYVHLLYWSRAVSAQRLFKVINEGWLDNRTRVVFVEINLYNVHLNFFATLIVMAERAASGVFDVTAQIDSAKLIAADPFRNTWMYMTYTLIPLLLVYVVYYFQESSAYGVATIVSWQGLINLAIIMMSFNVINLNFDKATRFNVFSERLNTAVRDQFTPLFVPFYNDLKVELYSACFGLFVSAAMASAVYRLLGYGNFKKMFVPVRAFMVATIVVNFLVNIRSSAAFKTLGIVNLNMEVVDTFFKSMPHAKLNRLSHTEQSMVIIFIPICFFFVKTLLGAVIFYYDHGSDETPQKIGLSSMFVRRATDPELHKQLDKQDKVLQKKMDAVTNKLLQVSKKYRKKKGDKELFHAKRKVNEKDDEPLPKGWLEAVWGSHSGHKLEDLELEPYHDVKLPPGFKKGFQPAEYKPPELQVFEDKKKNADSSKKSDEQKRSADKRKKSEQRKASAGGKKSTASKPADDRKKSEPTFIGGKKSLPKPEEDVSKSLMPKSIDNKKKSVYKDAEDRKKSEVPKSVDDKKKSFYKDAEDRKKSEVPKPADDSLTSVYKEAEDRKESEVPKPADDKKKSLYKDTNDREKPEGLKVEDKKESKPETPSDSKKSELPDVLEKTLNARKSKASAVIPKGKDSKAGVTSEEPERGVAKPGESQGEENPDGSPKQAKTGRSGAPLPEVKPGLNIGGAASLGMKPGAGGTGTAPLTPPTPTKPGGPGTGKINANVTWGKPEAGGPTGFTTTAKPGAPPSRRMEYRGPGIPPGTPGTMPALGKPGTTPLGRPGGYPPGAKQPFRAGKSASSPKEPSLGTPRSGAQAPEPSAPRKPLDWVFNLAKRQAPPPLSEAAVQSSNQQSQLPQNTSMGSEEKSLKRPRPDQPPGSPQEPRRPPERHQQTRRPPPGSPQPPRRPPPGSPQAPRRLPSSPKQPRRPPGGPQQPGRPPGSPHEPRRPPEGQHQSRIAPPSSPQEPRRPPGGPQQPGRPPGSPQEPKRPPPGSPQPPRRPPPGNPQPPRGPQEPGGPDRPPPGQRNRQRILDWLLNRRRR